MRRKTDFTQNKSNELGAKGSQDPGSLSRLPVPDGGAARTEGAMVYEGPEICVVKVWTDHRSE